MSINVKAAPTVSDVTIMGQPLVGGTITGSYLYQNADENPESGSTFCWYNGGKAGDVIATTLDLTLLPEHDGMELTFSVTPSALSGETGEETFSEPIIITTGGFQNISDEESENSYLKQRGQYAFHANTPKDGMITTSAGAMAFKNRVTQNLTIFGASTYGGVVPDDIKRMLENNPAATMFSTHSSFGALVPVGRGNQLLAWGPNMPANKPIIKDVKAVYTNETSIAFIYKDPKPGEHTIGAIGSAATGGEVPLAIQTKLFFDPPTAIYSTTSSFAVLTKAGKVYAWGPVATGGVIPANVQAELDEMKVERIIASSQAFCAISDERHLIGWGTNGTIPADALDKIYNDKGVQTVIANEHAFCAITLDRKKAVTWGSPSHGGTMSEAAASLAAKGNLVLCGACPWAFCFVNDKGQAAAWGYAGYGGGPIPTRSMAMGAMGAMGVKARTESVDKPSMNAQALFEEGDTQSRIESLFEASPVAEPSDAEAFGAFAAFGAFSAPPASTRVSSRVATKDGGDIELVRNDGSFVLISRDADGRTKDVIAWGLAATGGTLPDETRQVLMASTIRKVYCSNGAFAALVDQGQTKGAVVAWGRPNQDGGLIPPALQSALNSGVVEIYTVQSRPSPSGAVYGGFVARKEDNRCVTWGGLLPAQDFDPARDA
ncbi:hypothetical protein PMI27_004173 [Pseudomonas sp. GM41(2012)]|uniref:hypothetical protein n=1 Tax=Pseudomonas sp. (strain GM41(2012)) TaxID=1144708 RepID=UPI0002700169|nr:hypothetical protein [Pseudomonas sp. GM41(2012)]EUB72251.1 hypothetical protein PMI27_004173 [Pseudomonas sp. GM41(2012)]